MNRFLTATLCCLLPSCVIVLGDGHQSRRGSGVRTRESRDAGPFQRVEFRGAGDVFIGVGGDTSLTLSGDSDLIGGVTTEVHGDTLIIQYPGEYDFDEQLHVHINMPSLQEMTISGSADVDIKNVQSSALSLGIYGSGNIHATGSAKHLEANISGSGDLDLLGLASDEAEVRISGSGEMELNVAQSLEYRISGSGDIEFIGNARAQGSISGSGSVRRSD